MSARRRARRVSWLGCLDWKCLISQPFQKINPSAYPGLSLDFARDGELVEPKPGGMLRVDTERRFRPRPKGPRLVPSKYQGVERPFWIS